MASYIKLETEVTLKNQVWSVQDGVSLNYQWMVSGSLCTQHWTVPTDCVKIQICTKYMSRKLSSSIFYVCSSVHHNSRLNKSNKMQQYADIYLLLNYCTRFGRPSCPSSGVHKAVVAASGSDRTIWGASFLKRDPIWSVWRSLLPRQYDLYQRLQLQLYVLLMMGVMDAQNVYSNLAVYKYLRTVASCWISSTYLPTFWKITNKLAQ